MKNFLSLLFFCATFTHALANPYPFKEKVPKDKPYEPKPRALSIFSSGNGISTSALTARLGGKPVLRVQINWDEKRDRYELGPVYLENSGTEALYKRSQKEDPFGSFKGSLKTGSGEVFYDSLGIGQEYRKLTRAITFRFPLPKNDRVHFEMRAENPATGIIEKVFLTDIQISETAVTAVPIEPDDALEVQVLKAAKTEPKLLINIYAEGYLSSRKNRFWKDAQKVIDAFEKDDFPLFDQLEFRAVFFPSNTRLGKAKNLGMPIEDRNSFLGLYYPYWDDFGRWYHIVYPTREEHFRNALALAAYDYPIALVDSDEYWGVGNYKELTAIPANDARFTYLLLHEFGHFMGLNEEYEGGGPTELAFSPAVDEPWSPNITFLRGGTYASLKWKTFVNPETPIPTPNSSWNRSGNTVYGAYEGGYADSEPLHQSHKPGLHCVMDHYEDFCAVCKNAITEVIRRDLGL